LSGSTVKLAAAPASGSDYFAIVLGSTVNIGTPSNNTVTSAMIVDGSIVNADISNSADIAGSKLSLVSTSSTAGIIVKGDGSSDGYLQLNCSQNSHGIKLKSPPHSANQNYTLTFPSNIVNGAFLKTDANGNLSFAAVNTDLVNDTSPQLGGDLDANGQNIAVDGGNNITIGDNGRLRLGASQDLDIYHDNTNSRSRIEHSTDNTLEILQGGNAGMLIQNQNSFNIEIKTNAEDAIKCIANGAVELYHDNSKKFETRGNGTQITGTVLAGSSTPAAENSTYVFQAVGASQAFISAYASNTGTNLNSHGIHFGQDTSRGYLTQREDKDIYFYTNNAHRLTLSNSGNLVPASNDTYDLGASSLRWRNIYTNDLNLSNEGSSNDVDGTWGSYTIQEGADDLFLINKRNGKKYKFNLTEVN